MEGTVEAIYVGAEAQGPMGAVEAVQAVAGAGLEGDRYAAKAGTFSGNVVPGRAVTLIESEAVEAAGRTTGWSLGPATRAATW